MYTNWTPEEQRVIDLAATKLALALAGALKILSEPLTEQAAIDNDLYITCFELWSNEPEIANRAWFADGDTVFWDMVWAVEAKAKTILEKTK